MLNLVQKTSIHEKLIVNIHEDSIKNIRRTNENFWNEYIDTYIHKSDPNYAKRMSFGRPEFGRASLAIKEHKTRVRGNILA